MELQIINQTPVFSSYKPPFVTYVIVITWVRVICLKSRVYNVELAEIYARARGRAYYYYYYYYYFFFFFTGLQQNVFT